ncbi:MAG: DNA-directed RNA polymerase subunit beta [Patescibacteria group bacterium]
MLKKKHFSRFREPLAPLPNLVEGQIQSYRWFLEKGLAEVFSEFTSIKDYTEKKFEFKFEGMRLDRPKYNEFYAKENKVNYEATIKATIKLVNKITGSEKEQEIFMTDIPMMTEHGTFIINGIERCIVPQLARSFGAFFTSNEHKGRRYIGAKIIPARGSWIEIDADPDGGIYVKMDKKRKFPITTLLRAFGAETDSDIKALVADHPEAKAFMDATLAKDHAKTPDESYVEIYKKMRDGELATAQNAKEFVQSMFKAERYDLSPVGRFRFNSRFGKPMDEKSLARATLSLDDFVTLFVQIVELSHKVDAEVDDVDHLGSRRVKFVGEQLQQKVRLGLLQIKKNIQNRMSTIETEVSQPMQMIAPRPLQARVKEYFSTNQLSQFMSQENILAELEHLRIVTTLGQGGLTRERAGVEVRDVHSSHYGRVCPIHTPEGQNIGLVLHLAAYAKVNHFGMIETPYVTVKNGKITKEVKYYDALQEEGFKIAHAAINYDKDGNITDEMVEVRLKGDPIVVHKSEIDLIDVAPEQPFSISTSMIPFVNHDNANRSLMGSNMQKQATPCIVPEAAYVATGIEDTAARDTGRVILAPEDGEITQVDASGITVTGKRETKIQLAVFNKTNQFTAFHQRPTVALGQKVKRGDVLADTSTSVEGQAALGQNILIAFLAWSGANYEDAIIISEDLVKQSKFTTIHIEEFVINVRDTKLGPEVTTHDIPNVSEGKLKDLDAEGVVRIGAEVRPGDILVGKITPKTETQLTPEERLLRSIFGDRARDVKDTSKRLENGKRGRVIGVKTFSRERGDKLESGIIKRIYIEVALLRNVSVGDKLAGRHGNKGVISRVLPVEDMPYMADGTPVDMILTPLGVPSRMNLGQILELHLGLAAAKQGYQAIVPAFMGPTTEEVQDELEKAGYNRSGKMKLFDGRTGEAFAQDVSVGYMYMLKLHHMVEDKIHARSTGPYSLITQQPLGGKAQGGGQRFGEMEVWALAGYGASYTLREMLTIKSDDIVGRSAAYDAIVKGERLSDPNTPASFNVLLSNLRGLCIDVGFDNKDGVELDIGLDVGHDGTEHNARAAVAVHAEDAIDEEDADSITELGEGEEVEVEL